jgi:mannosyltransferase
MNPANQSSPPTRYVASLQKTLGVLAVILLAFGLRFHNLGIQSLWNDEGSSYVQATRSFADIAANAARDIHPPGYYWLLSGWRIFTGDTEFALRSLSAFTSLLTVAFTYALGRRLFSPLAGLFAALFVALNTFSIYYAQEARMYALLALWSVMGMWALAGVLGARYEVRGAKRVARSTLYLALINAAGLYTQYAYPFVMLAQGAVVIVWIVEQVFRRGLKPLGYQKTKRTEGAVQDRPTNIPAPLVGLAFPAAGRFNVWRHPLAVYILANLLALLVYLPWLPTALHQVTSWPSTGQPIPGGEALGIIGGWFAIGVTAPPMPSVRYFISAGAVAIVLSFLVGWPLAKVRAIWRRLLPVLWMIVPIGIFLALGLFRQANLKFLLPSQIGFALCLGLGLARLWEGFRSWGMSLRLEGSNVRQSLLLTRLIAAILTLALLMELGASIQPLYTDPAYQRPGYREIVRQITTDPRPGDAIILDAPNQEEVFRYYYKGDAPVYPLPPGLGGNDAETRTAVGDIIARHDRIFVLFWGEAERDPNRIVETALDENVFQAGVDTWYGDVRFARYETPAALPGLFLSGAQFGDHIALKGYALNARIVPAGDVLQVRLDWTTDAPLNNTYKVFVQLLNSDGVLVTQRDSEPGGGSQPTMSWTPGETVTDLHGLAIPPDLSLGRYTLIVGLYDRDDASARLPVNGSDYLELGQIVVEE